MTKAQTIRLTGPQASSLWSLADHGAQSGLQDGIESVSMHQSEFAAGLRAMDKIKLGEYATKPAPLDNPTGESCPVVACTGSLHHAHYEDATKYRCCDSCGIELDPWPGDSVFGYDRAMVDAIMRHVHVAVRTKYETTMPADIRRGSSFRGSIDPVRTFRVTVELEPLA